MEISVDGRPLVLPEGATAVFVDTSGNLLGLLKVEGGKYVDLRTRPFGTLDPTKEEHTELGFDIAFMPVSSDTPSTQRFESLRICRNQSGNVVKCPPR